MNIKKVVKNYSLIYSILFEHNFPLSLSYIFFTEILYTLQSLPSLFGLLTM